MNIVIFLSWLAFILGISVIIGIFSIVMKDIPQNLFTLHLSVSLLAYALFFVDILLLWVNWEDTSKSRIGSIGLRWFFTWMYAIFIITTIILCNYVYHIEFPIQLIIHGILGIFLILGISGALLASNKVSSIYKNEKTIQLGVIEMHHAMNELKDATYDFPNTPDIIKQKIEELEEELHYISPSNNPEASALEQKFIQIIHDAYLNINNHPENSTQILPSLNKAKHILKSRKSIYSL